MENSTPVSSHQKLDRMDLLQAGLCFVAGLALYSRTLVPGLLPGDSGEFQTLSFLLGHTHPTGYPIYLVLEKLATLIPIGDIAYRVNLFSALMGALTLGTVYLIGRLLAKHRVLAVAGTTVLAVSPTFWSQAVIAEVYTAGAAFLAIILLALLWWDQENDPRALFVAGLLGGLSLGVHMSVALLAPAVLVFTVLHWRRGKQMWRAALVGAACGVFLTVLIFWLIDLHNPTANYFNSIIEPSRSAWGLTAEMIDGPLERLIFGWSARQFRTFMFSDVSRVMADQAAAYWQNLPHELSWPVIGLALVGGIALLIRRTKVGFLLLVGLSIQLVYMFNYEIWDLYVFYIPSYVLLVLLFMVGMGTAVDLGAVILRRAFPRNQIQWMELALGWTVSIFIFALAAWPIFRPQLEAVIAAEVPFDFDEYPSYDENLQLLATAVVLSLPENAIVFTDWDMVWPYYYTAHIVENRRDLTFIETYPADDVEGAANSITDYMMSNLDEHPIFFSEREPALLDDGFKFASTRIGPLRLVRVTVD